MDQLFYSREGDLQFASQYVGMPSPGMSLRDYFAANVSVTEAQALAPQTPEECRAFLGMSQHAPWDGKRYPEILATIRYRIADAMIAARKTS
ncbi:MAG: hypothetical protein ACK5U7_11410 [Bacteroidota bacterium]